MEWRGGRSNDNAVSVSGCEVGRAKVGALLDWAVHPSRLCDAIGRSDKLRSLPFASSFQWTIVMRPPNIVQAHLVVCCLVYAALFYCTVSCGVESLVVGSV